MGRTTEKRQLAYAVGDVVGCGINPQLSKVFFTLNGKMIGWYEFSWLSREQIYPSVSLIDGDQIFVNGLEKFHINTFTSSNVRKST